MLIGHVTLRRVRRTGTWRLEDANGTAVATVEPSPDGTAAIEMFDGSALLVIPDDDGTLHAVADDERFASLTIVRGTPRGYEGPGGPLEVRRLSSSKWVLSRQGEDLASVQRHKRHVDMHASLDVAAPAVLLTAAAVLGLPEARGSSVGVAGAGTRTGAGSAVMLPFKMAARSSEAMAEAVRVRLDRWVEEQTKREEPPK